MAMIIRVRRKQVVRCDPGNEQPYSEFRTTGIFLVPNDYDYAAQCDDTTSVDVIAENIPERVEFGFREVPTPKLELKDEGNLCDIILQNAHLLTCYNCGERLEDAVFQGMGRTEDIGVLCIDPGRDNYPREPDEQAEVYFECMKCKDARKRAEESSALRETLQKIASMKPGEMIEIAKKALEGEQQCTKETS